MLKFRNMKKAFILLLTALLLSCQSKENTDKFNEMQNRQPEVANTETAMKGKDWLVKNIEGYFKNMDLQMIAITTPEYNEFKTDALNAELGMPGSLTKEEFIQKWTGKYDLSREDIYNAFLIPAQDFGRIKVTNCEYKNSEGDTLVYDVNISDVEFKADYKSIIKLVPVEKGFLIADVIETE